MSLDAPPAAFAPFLSHRVRLHLSASGADPARPVECMAQVLLSDPFRLAAVTGAGSLPSATTWQVTVPRSALPCMPRAGVVVEVLDGGDATPRRLTAVSAHANGTGGPLVHLECEARGGAR